MEISNPENVLYMIVYTVICHFLAKLEPKLFQNSKPKVEEVKEEAPKEETKVDILKREIKEMKIEAEKLNNPSTFAKHAKMNRMILKKQNELESEIKKVSY